MTELINSGTPDNNEIILGDDSSRCETGVE
jgi:hypothetical protein